MSRADTSADYQDDPWNAGRTVALTTAVGALLLALGLCLTGRWLSPANWRSTFYPMALVGHCVTAALAGWIAAEFQRTAARRRELIDDSQREQSIWGQAAQQWFAAHHCLDDDRPQAIEVLHRHWQGAGQVRLPVMLMIASVPALLGGIEGTNTLWETSADKVLPAIGQVYWPFTVGLAESVVVAIAAFWVWVRWESVYREWLSKARAAAARSIPRNESPKIPIVNGDAIGRSTGSVDSGGGVSTPPKHKHPPIPAVLDVETSSVQPDDIPD